MSDLSKALMRAAGRMRRDAVYKEIEGSGPMRQKPAGQMTRTEIGEQIRALAAENIRAGMDAEAAIAKAGADFREMRRKQADDDIAYCKKRLGIATDS